MFWHLLSAPKGARVSLEHLDDVAVHYANGDILLEQTKSALAHNPLSDWSVDLWKTIGNWIDDIEAGRVTLSQTTFQIYVTPIYQGDLSSAISQANTASDVHQLVSKISAQVTLKPPADACLVYITKFLNFDDARRQAFVERIQVISADLDPIDALRKLLSPTTNEESVDILCAVGIGLAKERADALIRQKKPAIVSRSDFLKEFHAFVRKNNMPSYLNSISPPPAKGEVESLLSSRPDFVAQLDLINVQKSQRLLAVSDFLRTSSDKVIWADQGLVYPDSFDELDDDLLRKHSAIGMVINSQFSEKDDVSRGAMVYGQCAQLSLPVEGKQVPGHFTHGSFNALANTRRLGWHPKYPELLEKEDEE